MLELSTGRSTCFCAPDEGAAAVVMCRADIAHRYTDKPVHLKAVDGAPAPTAPTR